MIRWNRVTGVLAGVLADLIEEAFNVRELLGWWP